ncbi:MAG: hypothetical protein KGZ83_19325 [Sulfuricella sp.]|nr:hypothetical protein [Sulfuricella sp.]
MDFVTVVTQPLGLAGFALSLVFGALSFKKSNMPNWWPKAAMALAAIALLGGLGLAYRQAAPVAPPPVVTPQPVTPAQPEQVAKPVAKPAPKPAPAAQAKTQGDCSPAFAGVQVGGDLKLDCKPGEKQKP